MTIFKMRSLSIKRTIDLKKKFVLLITRKSIKEIAVTLGINQSNVRRAYYKLKKLGLLNDRRKATQEGLLWFNLPAPIERDTIAKNAHFRLHNLQFTIKSRTKIGADIYDQIESVFHIDKIWQASYTTFREFHERDIRIRLVGNTFCIYIPEIISQSPEEAKNKALDILWHTISKIEQKLNVKLYKTPEMVITVGSQHIAMLNEPLAASILKAGIKFRVLDINGNIIALIDNSKGYQELEFVNWKTAEIDTGKIRDMYFDITRNNAWQNSKEEIEKLKKDVHLLKKHEKNI